MTLYSVQPKDCIFVKGYGFLSFAENMGRNIDKNKSKNLSSKYSQKCIDHAKRYATDALKTASKGAIRITQKYMKKKYLQKDIYLPNKDRELMVI